MGLQTDNSFFYEHQLTNYEIQFMAVFADLYVQVGKNKNRDERLIKVPIYYGAKDRVAAAIKADNTQNKPVRIPAMSSVMSTITLAPELYKGVAQQRRNTLMPTGGVFPDDVTVVEQRMPVPYKGEFELVVWASNQDQHHQIMEQILMLFDPTMQIQTSDDVMDWKRITTIELTGINNEENYPVGTDRRIIATSLNFTVPMYISVPVNIHKRIVHKIYQRIGAVSQAAETSFEMVEELNQQDIPYELIVSSDSIDFK